MSFVNIKDRHLSLVTMACHLPLSLISFVTYKNIAMSLVIFKLWWNYNQPICMVKVLFGVASGGRQDEIIHVIYIHKSLYNITSHAPLSVHNEQSLYLSASEISGDRMGD